LKYKLTQNLLHNLIFYNPITGECKWRWRNKEYFKRYQDYLSWNNKYAYKLINNINGTGYKRATLFYKQYSLHRLIWLYIYGEWPDNLIDHIDQNKLNNKISNLRIADKRINSLNSKLHITNTSGIRGMSFNNKINKWRAYYNQKHLGLFDNVEDAIKARKNYEDKIIKELYAFKKEVKKTKNC
jgi:hypothetical protein